MNYTFEQTIIKLGEKPSNDQKFSVTSKLQTFYFKIYFVLFFYELNYTFAIKTNYIMNI